MSNRNLIIEEFENSRGDFVIDWGKVKRLVGVVDDKEDYYWAYFNGREITLSSCVGGFTVLKNKIDDKDYKEFIRLAKLNHFDLLLKKDEEKYKEVMEKVIELQGEDEWIAGPYFEIE